MGYTEDDRMVRVDFFKTGGKWYCTEAVEWTGSFYGTTVHGMATSDQIQHPVDAFKTSLRNHLGDRFQEMTAVCLEPYHEFSFPLMIKDGGWNNRVGDKILENKRTVSGI